MLIMVVEFTENEWEAARWLRSRYWLHPVAERTPAPRGASTVPLLSVPHPQCHGYQRYPAHQRQEAQLAPRVIVWM
jgi:hypothetical protein